MNLRFIVLAVLVLNAHFSNLLDDVESMMFSGKPAWPVEGTLLTTGTLSALMISLQEGGRKIEMPHWGAATPLAA